MERRGASLQVVCLLFSSQSLAVGFNPEGQMFYLEGREIKREKM